MIEVSGTVALIPARGGSQRIPRKNIKDFLGTPSIVRVIETLRASGVVEDIIVSTDDEEIASVATAAGARAPFRRPAELADSLTGARPVIQHAIQSMGWGAQTKIGVFYPTAVLTTERDITESVKLLDEADTDFVMTVAEFPAPVQRALAVSDSHRVTAIDDEHILSRSQDLAPAYHDIGQFYWGNGAAWLTTLPVVKSRTRAFVVDAWRAVDIDTPEDWERAEKIYGMLHGPP